MFLSLIAGQISNLIAIFRVNDLIFKYKALLAEKMECCSDMVFILLNVTNLSNVYKSRCFCKVNGENFLLDFQFWCIEIHLRKIRECNYN